ncbi:GerAB/ArcD/ProY family transporter [Brevibacillus daliensis]|uniref:GerAB/ArcD/ProY family transporter n=1 Tax=Brevibacillus daliensis TaxID=2892995 RepID=UPI001E3FB0C5|nr:endospore germination permease [Brevibacillus daliensis]
MRSQSINNISLMQYIFIIHGTQVGIGILTLPRELTEIAGTDGWISILIGGAFSILVSILITSIMKKHPDKTLYDLLLIYFGSYLGTLVNFIVVLYGALATITVIFTTLFVINVWVLVETPTYLILAGYLIPLFIIGSNGIKALGRYSEITFYFSIWMPILLLFPLKDAHVLNLLPVVKEGWYPIISAVRTTFLSFLGFEMAFFFYPYLTCKQHATKGIIVANLLSLGMFLVITMVSYLFFSPKEITQYEWPTLTLLKVIEFSFLERFEIIYLSFYMYVLSTTWLPYTYVTILGSQAILKKGSHKKHLLIFIFLLLLISIFFQPSYLQIAKLAKTWGSAGYIMGYVFPVLLGFYIILHHFFKTRKSA